MTLANAGAPRLILYTDGRLDDPHAAKTAHGVLRFCPERVVAIVDRRFAAQPLRVACPWVGELDVPIVGSLGDLAGLDGPVVHGSVVVGLAPVGGRLSDEQRRDLLDALDAGYEVINGLHEQLPAGPNTVNLRGPDRADRVTATGDVGPATRILTVGTSGAVGKMTTTILLNDALAARGVDVDWLATGQTGVIIRGRGAVIDSVVVDFVPGTIERLLRATEAAVVVIEGQGSIYHPAFSPSAVALMHAGRPQLHVVCLRLEQTHHVETGIALPSVDEVIRGHQAVFEVLGVESELLAVSLDSSDATPEAYERERDAISGRYGVPCCDPVRESAAPFAAAFLARCPG